jgi:LysR family transcriptional regulator (chromosome initiation inhibitor)
MFDPAQLAALATIHRRGTFEAAAAELHVTPSAISQRIKALEESTGTLLLTRGQPCAATATGLRLIRHHDDIALLTRQLSDDLPGPAPGLTPGPATLRIAVNADSLATWVIPALAATQGLLYHLIIDDQDISHDWLKRGEVVAAITSHPGPLQGCDTASLGALRYRATASPGFAARWFPDGLTPEALTRAPSLVYSREDRLQHRWAQGLPGTPTGRRPRFPAHMLPSSHAFVDAALTGLGWGMNPEQLVTAHLEAGRLTDLAPDHPLDVSLHWQFTRLAAPTLAPLTRALRAEAAKALVPPP